MEDNNIRKTRLYTSGQEDNKKLDLKYGMPTRKQHWNKKDPETKEIQTTWIWTSL